MTVYIMGQLQIHNSEWMEEYFAKVPAIVKKYRGRFLVREGNPEKLEGNPPPPDLAYILEFPDRDHALAFWNSDEFAPLAELRRTGSALDSILVDGIEVQ